MSKTDERKKIATEIRYDAVGKDTRDNERNGNERRDTARRDRQDGPMSIANETA